MPCFCEYLSLTKLFVSDKINREILLEIRKPRIKFWQKLGTALAIIRIYVIKMPHSVLLLRNFRPCYMSPQVRESEICSSLFCLASRYMSVFMEN